MLFDTNGSEYYFPHKNITYFHSINSAFYFVSSREKSKQKKKKETDFPKTEEDSFCLSTRVHFFANAFAATASIVFVDCFRTPNCFSTTYSKGKETKRDEGEYMSDRDLF